LKAEYLHITIAIGGPIERRVFAHCCWCSGSFQKQSILTYCSCCWEPFESRMFAHYSCSCGPFQKQSTYALPLLLGALLKAKYLHIAVDVRGIFERRALTHYSCCWGPFWKHIVIYFGVHYMSR